MYYNRSLITDEQYYINNVYYMYSVISAWRQRFLLASMIQYPLNCFFPALIDLFCKPLPYLFTTFTLVSAIHD